MNKILRKDIRKKAVLLIICVIVLVFGGYLQQTKLSKSHFADSEIATINAYAISQKLTERLLKELDEKNIEPEERPNIITNWIQKYKALYRQLNSQTDVIAKQAYVLLDDGKLEDAEKLLNQSLASQSNFGKEAAADAFSLAHIKILQLNYLAAKNYFQQAAKLDPENPLYLDNLAHHLYTLAEYKLTEYLYQRSLAIWGKSLGKSPSDIAIDLINVAELCTKTYNYTCTLGTKQLYHRGLILLEMDLEKNYLNLISVLNNPAIKQSYLEKNNFYLITDLNKSALKQNNLGSHLEVAESMYQHSLAAWGEVVDKDRPNSLSDTEKFYVSHPVAAIEDKVDVSNLTRVQDEQYEYAIANASSLNTVARFYAVHRDYAKAEPLYLRTLAIIEKYVEPVDPYNTAIAESLTNLADVYLNLRNFAKAEPLYQRSLLINKQTSNILGSGISISLINLAIFYDSQGMTSYADPLYQDLLNSSEPNNLTGIVNSLIEKFKKQGNYMHARLLNQRSFDTIKKETLRDAHRNTETNQSQSGWTGLFCPPYKLSGFVSCQQ
jgi:tetratricopeptide (TPR) repeat protein